ncbi:MAG: outer membrane beta-barrel protein [Gammaproteobacteria bacterium]|nr:outer membrane beta-barrel protein [Gammaproteobacteria bacterium]
MKRMIMAAALLLLAGAAMAEGEPKFIVGTAAAFSDFKGDPSYPVDDSGLGIQIYAQARANSWFAIEGGYFSSGEFSQDIDPGNNGTVDLSMTGFNIAAVGFIPIFPNAENDLDLYGKLGLYDFDIDRTVQEGNSQVPGSLGHSTGLFAGVGIVLNIGSNIGIRTEALYFDIDNADLWTLNMGVQIGF